MSAAATEGEPYVGVGVLLREIRERVGDDVHDMVVERQALAGQDELVESVRQVGRVSQRIVEARGRQLQAQESGLPQARAIRDEREARELLRSTVMSLAGVCGAWVVAMDFEMRKGEVSDG